MLTLIWRASARADLRAIITYISEHNRPAADRLLERVMACAERLPEFPYIHRTGRIAGTRELVIHPNYILIYRVTAEVVEITNVIHSRQQYP